MKKHHWNGSLITAARQSPSSSAANGLFNLVSQQVFKSASKWPGTVVAPYVTSGLNLYLDAGDSSSYVNYSTSGTTWSDVTANSNDGTLTNMATNAHTSSNGGYFAFDGTNDYVNGVNSSTTNITGSITVECLFRVSTGQNNWVRIFGKGDGTNRTYGLWYRTDTNQFLWQRYASGVFMSLFYTVSSFALDTWHYLVGVSDGTTHTLYLNNQQVATTTTSTSTFYSSTDPYTAGYRSFSTQTYHIGDISMVRLYNRALTSAERTTNYNNEKGRWDGSIVPTDLLLHLDAGDLDSYSGSGTTWTDLSSNNNDVTLVNGIGYSGANQGSLVFDGTNDYVREDTVLDTFTATSDTWSIECWFNTDVNPNVVECMIGVNYNNGQENTFLLGVINVNGTCKISVYYRNINPLGSYGTVTVGQWHHVVATHASEGLKVYLDGVQIASNSNTVNRSLDDCAFLIGAELDSGSSLGNYFDGKISSTLVYSKALTATEVGQNFNALKSRYGYGTSDSVVTNGLIVHLDAADTTSYPSAGTTWYDLTSNSNDGTLTNMDATNHSSSGGGYFTFDGTNEYIDISGSTTVTAASFVVWVRLDGDQYDKAGILFSRSNDATGLAFNGTTEKIRYEWNGASNTWGWDSGLTIPQQEWCMIAVTVTSSSATAYLFRSSGVSSSTNNVSHSSTTLDSLELGRDSARSGLYDGRIGVAQVYNRSLSSAELTANFNALKGRYGLS